MVLSIDLSYVVSVKQNSSSNTNSDNFRTALYGDQIRIEKNLVKTYDLNDKHNTKVQLNNQQVRFRELFVFFLSFFLSPC